MDWEMAYGQWGAFTPAFVDGLAARLAGLRTLEVFAGNGRLASMLAEGGVDVRATSLFQGHDGHERGLHHEVEEMDALAAVRTYGATSDVLLMCWPTTTQAAVAAVLEWGADRPILFVGEVTDRSVGFLGGCATDEFFDVTERVAPLPGYAGRSSWDKAWEMRTLPGPAARWRSGMRTWDGILGLSRDAGIDEGAEETPPGPSR